jgi:hypothetical protein
MNFKTALIVISILFLAACGPAGPDPTPYPTPVLLSEEGMITYYQMSMADGTILEYGVVLSHNFVAGETYPVLIAFPPGPQTKAMVELS